MIQPFFGEGVDYVTCQVCGKQFKTLGIHLPIHNITKAEYKKRFSKTELTCSKTKQNIGEASKGRIVSCGTRQKISESNKGRLVSPETRQKIRVAAKGRKASEETRQKMSLAQTGKKQTTEQKGMTVLRTVLRRMRSDEQGGYPSYDGNGKWSFISTGMAQVTGDELNVLFAFAGIEPDEIVCRGPCEECVFATEEGRERGYEQPCCKCMRPSHSNFVPITRARLTAVKHAKPTELDDLCEEFKRGRGATRNIA